MKVTSKTVLILPLVAAACGNGAGADYSPTLVTLHGAIKSSSVQTTADVRVALVWQQLNVPNTPGSAGSALLRSTQELNLRAQFPSSFKMIIDHLPPSELMTALEPPRAAQAGIDPKLRVAAGTLVVYEDTNGNGKLDLLPVDGKSVVDRVLGVPQGVTVLYVEGTPPPAASAGYFTGLALQRGFNLLQETGWREAQPSTRTPWTLLPLSTEIPITLTAAPQMSRYMCGQDPALINRCALEEPFDPSNPMPPNAVISADCGPPIAGRPPAGMISPGATPPGEGNVGGNPPGTPVAAPVACGPDSAGNPCSQSSCMFGAPVAPPPPGQ